MTYFGIEEKIFVNVSSTNVGIGITNPTKTLQVVGDIDTSTDYNISGVQVLSSTTLGSAVVNASLTSNTGNLVNTGDLSVTGDLSIANTKDIKINSVTVLDSTTLGSGVISSSLTSVGTLSSLSVSGDINCNSNDITSVGAITASGNLSASATTVDSLIVDTTTLVVDATNNKVGMGTATPTTLLDLTENSSTTSALLIRNGNANSATNDGAQIEFGFQGTTDYSHYIHTRHNNVGANNAIDFYVCDGTTANTLTSGSTHTMSLNNGDVGIGITDPSYELDVAGDINLTGDLRINGSVQSFGGIWSEASSVASYTGDVAIGTSSMGSSSSDLRIHDTSWPQIHFTNDNSGNAASDGMVMGMGPDGEFYFLGRENSYMRFDMNGSEKMRISSNGNLGIGTTSPNAPLQFSNAAVNRKLVLFDNTNNDHQYFGFGINANVLRYQVSTGADHVFYSGTSTTTSRELMRIKGTGNVGIGSTTSDSALGVLTTDTTDRNAIHITSSDSPTGANDSVYLAFSHGGGLQDSNVRARIGLNVESGGDGRLVFQTATTVGSPVEVMRIDDNGNVGIGLTNPSNPLSVYRSSSDVNLLKLHNASSTGAAMIQFLSEAADTVIGVDGSNFNIVHTGDPMYVQAGTINLDSNVGIGRTPSWPLDIQGTARFIGTVDSSIDGGGVFTQTYFDKSILLNRATTEYRNYYLGILGDNTTSANKFAIAIDGGGGANPDPQMSLDVKGRMVLADGLSIGTEAEALTITIGDSDTGIDWVSDGNLAIWANNVSVMSITSAGLEVNGPVYSDNRIVHYRDEKSNSTHGGLRSGTGFRVRTLNTRSGDTSFTTFTNSTITFTQTGTYKINGRCPGYHVDRFHTRIQQTDDNNGGTATLKYGTSTYNGTGSGASSDSVVGGIFSISSGDVIQLQQYCQVSSGTHDYGVNASSGGTEVYSEMWIERLN